MRKTIRPTILALATLLVAGLLVAPLSSAQSVEVSAPVNVDGIQPGLAGEDISVTFTYRFDNAGQPLSSTESTTVEIQVTKSCDNNQFLLTGPGAVFITLQPSETETSTTATYSIAATRDAPGLTQTGCVLTATGQAVGTASGNAVQATAPYEHDFNAVADYYGAMQVQLANTIQRAAPQKEVPFNMEFTNFGNANTRIAFRIADESDRPTGERWQHILPTDVIVGSVAKGQENTATATFQVSTPYRTGWNNDIGSYRLTMTTEALDDPEQKGNTMTASILVRVRGVYVPGFEAVGLVGSLAGAVMLIRRRSE